MPTVDVDVSTIPDIIEAQLTLSYSRLTDLIRIIIEQGNGHEDDIGDMRDRMDQLQKDNEDLRRELDALKARGQGVNLESVVEQLQRDVERLSKESVDNAELVRKEAEDRAAAEKAAQDAANAMLSSIANLQVAQGDLTARVAAGEQRLSLCEAFTNLWGGRPEQIHAMATPSPTHPGDFEHSIEDRTAYLHTLPAFTRLFDELEIVRGMVQRQAADTLAVKTSESSRSRTNSDLNRTQNAALTQDLQNALRELEERLLTLERRQSASNASGQARGGNTDQLEREVAELQDRLTKLEGRLRLLLVEPSRESPEGGDRTSIHDNAALVDLEIRVTYLEETVEGLPRVGAPAAAVGTTVKSVPSTPHNTSGSSGAHSQQRATPESTGGEISHPERRITVQGPGSPNNITGRGSSLLPPLAPSPNTSSALLQSSTTQAIAPSTGGSRRQSVLGTPVRHVEQPVLETLRKQEAQSSQQQPPQSQPRRISVVVEQDDGLRLRVAQLEENCAILEVNKADRRDLQMLEQAMRNALLQHQVASAPNLVPQRPMSANYTGMRGSGSAPLVGSDQRGPSPDTSSRPRTASSGRPIFVGSSSINLRDGAQLTSATVTSNSNLS